MVQSEFTYIAINSPSDDEIKKYHLKTKLIDTESKHYVHIDTNPILHKLALKVEYNFSVFGSHRKTTIEDEKNRILNMKNSQCPRAVRFIIDQYDRVWSDNTHWTIAYVLAKGPDTRMIDIPIYIVDFRNEIPTIVNINNTVFDSTDSILSAISNAKLIYARINNGWRNTDISYKISELMSELNF